MPSALPWENALVSFQIMSVNLDRCSDKKKNQPSGYKVNKTSRGSPFYQLEAEEKTCMQMRDSIRKVCAGGISWEARGDQVI